jgi:hypothetical protein
MIQYANLYPSIYKESRSVDISVDYFESGYYASGDYQEFFNLVKERIPEMAYLLESHLSCSECRTDYGSNTDLKSLYGCGQMVDFKTIVDWVNNGKPNIEVDNASE